MTDATPLLHARGISKRFGGQQALDDVSLALAPGEIHGLAGENGAGKSTLMAVLSGALRPDSGTLVWEGRPVRPGDVAAARSLGIGMVHQEPQLVPALSVAENIGLGRLPARGGPLRLVDRSALVEQAARAIAPLGVAIAPEACVESLGVASRQLVAIARALHSGARLIILDEPTSSLSLEETERFFAVLRRLREQGKTIVYISHRLEELRAVASSLTVLRDGRVVRTAPIDTLTNDAILEAMSGPERLASTGDHAPSTVGGPALEVRGLERRGRLHDVTLRVDRGEIVGLAGLMGAGRSRALRSIFRADPADAGTVELRLEDGSVRPVATVGEAIEAGLGFVPEDRRGMGLVPSASVLDNIGLVTPPGGRRLGFLRRRLVRQVAEDAVATLRIKTPGLEAPVRVLSGGNQQKVVLARWLGAGRRVLLLDEPTRGVDVATKAELHRHLRALAARGLGLLVASSELAELLALCDRVYVMREGRIAGELPRPQATPAAILRLATGAR